MFFTIVTLTTTVILFLSLFTGGKSWRDIREKFYGNYFAEDGLINQEDKPNTVAAVQSCIDNGIGIKTEIHLTADRRLAVSTYADLSKEYGVDKKIEDCTMEQLEEYGVLSLSQLIAMTTDKIPLILELKGSSNNQAMCQLTADAIKASERRDIAVCSFNAGIMSWFRNREKDIFRGIVSAPAKEFKNLSKFERWTAGNLANNTHCRPNFMLYRNRPLSVLVKFAAMSGVLKGVWTLTDPAEAKALEEEKEMIIVRGFMPETIHFKDMPVPPAPQQPVKGQPAEDYSKPQAPVRQRSISEILADDEEESYQDGVFDELEAEVKETFDEIKEEITEAVTEIKSEIQEIKEDLAE